MVHKAIIKHHSIKIPIELINKCGLQENEEVILWGDLKARTLDKPINIYMSCETGSGDYIENGIIKPGALGNKENRYETDHYER